MSNLKKWRYKRIRQNRPIIVFGPKTLYRDAFVRILEKEMGHHPVIAVSDLNTLREHLQGRLLPALIAIKNLQSKSELFPVLFAIASRERLPAVLLTDKTWPDQELLFHPGVLKSVIPYSMDISSALTVMKGVLAGKTFAPEEIAFPRRQRQCLIITPRQVAILGAIGKGSTNAEIAREFGLALPTVKVHVRNIMRRLDVSTRTAAHYKFQSLGMD